MLTALLETSLPAISRSNEAPHEKILRVSKKILKKVLYRKAKAARDIDRVDTLYGLSVISREFCISEHVHSVQREVRLIPKNIFRTTNPENCEDRKKGHQLKIEIWQYL